MGRETILNAIRRTADANEGVPLGKTRFERETGIKESDWSGRYWVRWSDALAEAGFQPNVMQGRYHDLELLEHLVRVVEDLGKWPTTAELKLYARQNPGFPSHNSIRRLGRRQEQAQLVIDHEAELAPSSDVLALCRSVVAQDRKESTVGEPVPPSTTTGFVYLLKSGRYFKIGHSNDASRRAYEIRLQMPEKVTVVHEIETDDAPGIEAYWHRRFASKRRNGEWFVLDRSEVAAFRSRKSM